MRWRTLYDYEPCPEVVVGETHGTPYTKAGATFPPALTSRERTQYYDLAADTVSAADGPSAEVTAAIADLRWCNSLVLVYPTWW